MGRAVGGRCGNTEVWAHGEVTGNRRGAGAERDPMAAGRAFGNTGRTMRTSSSRASQRTDSSLSSISRRSSDQVRRSEQPQEADRGDRPGQLAGVDGAVEGADRRQSLPLQRAEAAGGPEAAQEIRETVAHEEIARRAYELWEQDGCPEGCSERHWLEAERQLRGSSFGKAPGEKDARDEARTIKASAERRAGAPARN